MVPMLSFDLIVRWFSNRSNVFDKVSDHTSPGGDPRGGFCLDERCCVWKRSANFEMTPNSDFKTTFLLTVTSPGFNF